MDEYGPFANVVGIACALIATFSILLLRMIGKTRNWTWLSAGSPPTLVTVGARVLAIGLMALTYITIDKSNYLWFAIAAIIFGIIGFIFIVRFEKMRTLHVAKIPLVAANGSKLVDEKGNAKYENIVIGSELNMRKAVKKDYAKAKKSNPSLSIRQFMSGYGGNINNPEALWDEETLANVSSKLTISLMCIFLCGVMVLFLSAFAIEVFNR